MAIHIKIILLICLFSPTVLMEEEEEKELKPFKKVRQLVKDVKALQERMKVQDEKMAEQEQRITEQQEKMKEQEEKIAEQEEKMKELEECKVCAKIKELNETLSELQDKIDQCQGSGRPSVPPVPSAPATCKEIYEQTNAQEDRAYELTMPDVGKISVYCQMSGFGLAECGGGGGWTLVMKIDGNKQTFHYDSSYWSDKNVYGDKYASMALDSNEVKLPTYWNTPFTKICLGMEVDGQRRFLLVEQNASSLYSLIADGMYRKTFLGRDKWKTLIGAQASLQKRCNREGFNSASKAPKHAKARIGIISDEFESCNKCDSRLGFGTGGKQDDSNTCGNEATYYPDNGVKHIKAMGYILVQ